MKTGKQFRGRRHAVAVGIASMLLLPVGAAAEDPVGGWAVIDPETGEVKSVIVCTESVCGETGEWGGVFPDDSEYAGSLLRKQTNATSDGNVAGWSSSEGVAVTYDGDEDGTFTIVSRGTSGPGDTVERQMTLDPDRTATDPDGMDLHTGIVERRTTGSFAEDEQRATISIEEQRPDGSELQSEQVVVEFDEWGEQFAYGSTPEAAASLKADVEAALGVTSEEPDAVEGEPAAQESQADEQSGGMTSEPEEGPVVRAIQTITRRIITFLNSLFGG